MANPAGFRTVSTVLPDALYVRLSAYLEVKGGSVSGFIKAAISTQLEGFNPETKSELQLALDDVKRMVDRYRKLFAKCVDLPPAKASEALALLEAELIAARPSFHSVAASDIKYEGLYKNMITGTRNKLRAAETKALITPEVATDAPAVQLPPRPPTTGWKPAEGEAWDCSMITADELAVLGIPADYRANWLEYSEKFPQDWVIGGMRWLRGHGAGGLMPDMPTVRYQGDTEFVEWAVGVATTTKNAKSLAYYKQVQAHLATLPPPTV